MLSVLSRITTFLLKQYGLVGHTEVAQEDLHGLRLGHDTEPRIAAAAQQDERCPTSLVEACGVPDTIGATTKVNRRVRRLRRPHRSAQDDYGRR